MKVIYKKLPFRKIDCVAAAGVFDGIHLGHRFVLEKLRKISKKEKASSLLITFDIPPQIILRKHSNPRKHIPGLLIDSDDKKDLVSALGIDCIWFLRTSGTFLKLSGKEFIKYILRYFNLKHIIIGEDFRFGHKGAFGVRYLEKISKEYGFKVTVLRKIRKHRKTISSSFIRSLVESAKFNEAKKFLGRNYYIKGKVVTGSGYGRHLGFPTANIDYDSYIIPERGVYSAVMEIDRRRYLCAVNIGARPTINHSESKILEAHILSFNKHITGKKIRLWFVAKIRNEKKFSSRESLIKAIARDVDFIKKHYSAADV